MKLFTAALLSLAALHQLADAWTIKSSQAESSPVGGHEAVSKTWTVSGSEALSSLQLRGFGRVFVSHDESFVGSGNAAKVVFSGSDASLLDVLEVSNGKGQGIQIHVKNEDYEGKGYLITRVYVAKKESIHSVDLVGSNDVYVSDGVVAQHSDSVKLSVTGSGDLYAGSGGDSWSVGKIDASVTGSGDIQLHANSLDVKDSLLLTVAGSGDIGVFADEARISNQLRTNVPGSGDVHVQSSNLEVNHLTTSVSGSGDVTYSNKGSCQKQEISVYGSGDVSAGSIVCVDTKVDVYGSGDVLVQTTGNLVVSAPTSGDVKYYGATPSHIETDDYSRFHHKKHESVKHATRNSYHEYRPKSLPEPSARYIALKTESSYFSDEPRIRYEYESDYYNEALVKNFITNQEHQNGFNLHVQDFAANTARHAPGFATLAVVGGALVVVGVAAKKFQARRERKEYQPLV